MLAACGGEGVDVGDDATAEVRDGAELFAERCGGCHTLKAAGTQGSGNRSQRAQGPNLGQRKESYDDVIFAIANGGFSGAIMPQNIAVGKDAEDIAAFVAKYAGTKAENPPSPNPTQDVVPPDAGATGESGANGR